MSVNLVTYSTHEKAVTFLQAHLDEGGLPLNAQFYQSSVEWIMAKLDTLRDAWNSGSDQEARDLVFAFAEMLECILDWDAQAKDQGISTSGSDGFLYLEFVSQGRDTTGIPNTYIEMVGYDGQQFCLVWTLELGV